MKQIKIKLHSMTDLITNSSTVIYTYSDASKEACEKMIDAIFETFGIDKKCSDIFNLVVTTDVYAYEITNRDPPDVVPPEFIDDKGGFSKGAIQSLLENIKLGKVEEPKWLSDITGEISDSGDWATGTTLRIIPKEA